MAGEAKEGVPPAGGSAVASVSADVPGGIEQVVVHPLVLLSVVDHYSRTTRKMRDAANKRVVGVLLGLKSGGTIDVTASYAIPFEEDKDHPEIWFLDHDYHEEMYEMSLRISSGEKIVGWYSSGPRIRECDIDVHEVFRKYVPHPVFVIVDVKPKELGLPTEAYVSVEEVKDDGTEPASRTFVHVPSAIGAQEAEEVGVEQLLRDVKDNTVTTLGSEVQGMNEGLRGLLSRLREMEEYLAAVAEGEVPMNHEIMNKVQDIFNLLPNLSVEELVRSFQVKTNDMLVVMYLSSLIRSVIALHNLINNKLANKGHEEEKKGVKVDGGDAAAAAAIVEEGKKDAKGAEDGKTDVKKKP